MANNGKPGIQKSIIGLIGCGAIGNGLAGAIQAHLSSRVELRYIHDLIPEHCARLCTRHELEAQAVGLEELIERSDYVIEAASAAISGRVAIDALSRDKTVQIMSVGGLLPRYREIHGLATSGTLLIPSGALAGIDAIKALGESRIDSVTLTTTKPPRGLAGAPWFDLHEVDLERLAGPTVIFEGGVLEAVRYFPKNINVAATLAIAVDNPELVQITIIAAPGATTNTHEICVTGDFGRITTKTENEPSIQNPRTSALAVLSAYEILAERFEHILVGT